MQLSPVNEMTGSKHGIACGDTSDAKGNWDYKACRIKDLLAPKVITRSASNEGAEKQAGHCEGPKQSLEVLIVADKVEPGCGMQSKMCIVLFILCYTNLVDNVSG